MLASLHSLPLTITSITNHTCHVLFSQCKASLCSCWHDAMLTIICITYFLMHSTFLGQNIQFWFRPKYFGLILHHCECAMIIWVQSWLIMPSHPLMLHSVIGVPPLAPEVQGLLLQIESLIIYQKRERRSVTSHTPCEWVHSTRLRFLLHSLPTTSHHTTSYY